MQDDLLPVVGRLQQEAEAGLFFASTHEDRIEELEADEESQLLPEDADEMLSYLEESVTVLERMASDGNVRTLDKLITKGKQAIKFVKAITLPDDEQEPGEGAEHDDD